MKNKLRIGGVITSVAAGILLSSTALAHHAGTANQSYVGNAASGNQFITDSSGNCVRTGSWKAEEMTVDCGAAPKVEEAKAPPPPPPAPAPAPTYETVTLSASALFDTNSAAIPANSGIDDIPWARMVMASAKSPAMKATSR